MGNPTKRQVGKENISFVYLFSMFSNTKRSRNRREEKKLKSGENQQSLSATASEDVFIHTQAFRHRTPSTQPFERWQTVKLHLSGQHSQFQKFKYFSEGQSCGHIAQTKQENEEITGRMDGRIRAGVMRVLVLPTGFVNRKLLKYRTCCVTSLPNPGEPDSGFLTQRAMEMELKKSETQALLLSNLNLRIPQGQAPKVMSRLVWFTTSSPIITLLP